MPKRPGRKSAAQTPAPKSEQIKGSKKNPKGSAASAKSAQKIALSRKIINTLQKKAKDFNEKYPSKKVSVSTLKAVFRRGAGAFSKSFRPTITGGKPNSRSAWAFARVNKFLDKKAGKAVKKAYVQDDDLLAFGGEISEVFKYSMKRVDTFLDKLSENLTPSKYTDDDDLLYNDGGRPNGGKVQELISDGIVDIKMFDTTNEHSKMYGFDAQNPLFVQSIVVSKEHRGKGIGSKVFEYIVDYAKENKHDLIFGHITQKAEPSIDLIKSILNKSGFNTIEANNDFYKIIDLKYSDGGTTLLAPNGKPSNLTPEQYKLVRTPEFKAWFGDWENDPANASKVVDENGEPLVVYHGTPRGSFNIFIEKGLVGSLLGKGFYFTNDLDKAKSYSERGIGNDPDPHVFEVFLNIRNIYSFKNKLSRDLILKNKTQDSDLSFNDVLIDDEYDEEGFELNKKEILLKKYYSTEDEWDSAEFLSYFIDKSYVLNSLGYDGIVLGNEIVCFSSNQIKLADGTNTTFDGSNPDIRFDDGGTTLLAPNGKPSNLTPEQYKLVRTPEFKAWFGDWENDPANASKVVDENGEPLVVYHGSKYKFNEFKLPQKHTKILYFAKEKSYSKLFLEDGGKLYECFLNIRKLLDATPLGLEKQKQSIIVSFLNKNNVAIKSQKNDEKSYLKFWLYVALSKPSFIDEVKKNYDGFKMYEDYSISS